MIPVSTRAVDLAMLQRWITFGIGDGPPSESLRAFLENIHDTLRGDTGASGSAG